MNQHRKYFVTLGLVTFALTLTLAAPSIAALPPGTGQVTSLHLRPEKDRATLVLVHKGAAKFRLFKSAKRGTVILEAENLSLPAAFTKLTDLTSAGGPVLQMTPYNSSNGGNPMAKLVIQLRGEADVTGSEGPGRFTVQIVKKVGALASALKELDKASSPVARDEVSARQAASSKEDVAKRLIEVLNAPQEDKRYFGSKVTFEAKDAEIPDIFRLVGESSELNIIWDSDVEGAKTSLAVKDLPWDQLLDIVIQQRGYKAIVMGNVVRIMTIDTFNKQAKARKEEISISDELEPVVMAVVPLSFAEAKDMKNMIDQLIQQKTSSGAGATSIQSIQTGCLGDGGGGGDTKIGQDFKRGKIEVDARTNSLVITNTKDAIERIRRLVRELDVAVPQILIDAKVVIAGENFSQSLGVRWQSQLTPPTAPGPKIAFGAGTSLPVTGGTAADFAVGGGKGAADVGMIFGTTRSANLTAALKISELNSMSKTISAPRVIVNNNTKAEISDNVTITQQVQTSSTTSTSSVSAGLRLSLTPQVTSRGSVQLKGLTIERGAPRPSGANEITVENKKVSTEVLVDSGATLVLGGVYQTDRTEEDNGIPILKDLPFLGWFFKDRTTATQKSELMVFITPQIIDPESSSQSL